MCISFKPIHFLSSFFSFFPTPFFYISRKNGDISSVFPSTPFIFCRTTQIFAKFAFVFCVILPMCDVPPLRLPFMLIRLFFGTDTIDFYDKLMK